MPAQLLGQQPAEQGPEPTIHEPNKAAFAELRQIREANQELIQQLAQHGIGMDMGSIIQTRITALIDTIYPSATPDGQARQIEIELRFENMMGQILSEARRSAVSAQLAAGAHVPPEMLEQVARASGQHLPPGLARGR